MTFDITDRIRSLEKQDFLVLEINGKEYILCRMGDGFRMFSRFCPHAGGDLTKARFENHRITCMNHGLCYRLEDGNLDLESIDEDIRENVDEEILGALKLKLLVICEEEGRYLVET